MSGATKALKYGGSTLLNAVNGITPHFAGAVDVMAVLQPDESFKSSPFYVRFGKYVHLRSRDRIVQLIVNGTTANFHMVLGTYGQAYFATETTEIISEDEEEQLQEDVLAGMSSPASEYSDDETAPYLTAQMAADMCQEIAAQTGAQPGASSVGAAGEQATHTLATELSLSDLLPAPDSPASAAGSPVAPIYAGAGQEITEERVVVMEKPPLPSGAFNEVLKMFDEDATGFGTTTTTTCNGNGSADADTITMVQHPHPTGSSSSESLANGDGCDVNGSSPNSSSTLNSFDLSSNIKRSTQPSGPPSSRSTAMAIPNGKPAGLTSASSAPPLGSSPDAGYLGDGEIGPRPSSASTSKVSSRSLGGITSELQGLQLSLCGHLLRKDIEVAAAHKIFDAHKVSAERYALDPPALLASPELVCRIGTLLLPWTEAAPVVVGMLAFGGRLDQLVASAAQLKAPASEKEQSTESPSKAEAQPGASSSTLSYFKLWPAFSWSSSKPTGSATPSKVDPKGTLQPMSPEGPQSPTGATRRVRRKKHIVVAKKSLSPTAEQLASLQLKEGQNTIVYKVGSSELHAYIYLFRWRTRLLISDVDGTITRSDLLGHVLPAIGMDWSHAGITQLYSNICNNGYKIMFLSSRAIAQASITRDYLHSLEQDGARMPTGPVIISPHGLLPSLYREMILRRPHEFKIACLQDIRSLFPPEWNPFYAGFGNRETDVVSYKEVGVSLSRIFIINPKGEIRKASSAVQSSTWSSLLAINDLVNEVFPALLPDEVASTREEYNDLQYWRSNTWYGADSLEENPKSPENTASFRQTLD